jgi:hypothetical protein
VACVDKTVCLQIWSHFLVYEFLNGLFDQLFGQMFAHDFANADGKVGTYPSRFAHN